jgi:hypothetical protein
MTRPRARAAAVNASVALRLQVGHTGGASLNAPPHRQSPTFSDDILGPDDIVVA